jgi:hypothetical protein
MNRLHSIATRVLRVVLLRLPRAPTEFVPLTAWKRPGRGRSGKPVGMLNPTEGLFDCVISRHWGVRSRDEPHLGSALWRWIFLP